jgi:hypothetical protein
VYRTNASGNPFRRREWKAGPRRNAAGLTKITIKNEKQQTTVGDVESWTDKTTDVKMT